MNRRHILPQAIVRLWPFMHGAGRLTDRFFSTLLFDNGICRVQTRHGYSLHVNPNDLIGRHIYLSGEFDHTVCRVLQSISRPGDVLFDIGANIGYVTCFFLSKVAASTVIAVEPQPTILEILRRNLDQFDPARYRIVDAAVSTTDGKGHLELCDGNLGASRLSAHGTEISVISGATLLARAEVEPDLVKIDVEGHECEVLEAIMPYCSPRALVFEHSGKEAAPGGAIARMLDKYTIFAIRKSLFGYNLIQVTSERDCCANDYLGVILPK